MKEVPVNSTKLAKQLLLNQTCNTCRHLIGQFKAGDSLSQSTMVYSCWKYKNKKQPGTCVYWKEEI